MSRATDRNDRTAPLGGAKLCGLHQLLQKRVIFGLRLIFRLLHADDIRDNQSR